jgi:hypothetical protein
MRLALSNKQGAHMATNNIWIDPNDPAKDIIGEDVARIEKSKQQKLDRMQELDSAYNTNRKQLRLVLHRAKAKRFLTLRRKTSDGNAT